MLLKKLKADYKNPQKFWRKIKMLKGNIKNTNNHLIIDNVVLTSDERKEEVHRRIWSDVFRISPEENQNYDLETEKTVNEFINNNNDQITIFQNTDIKRLQKHPLTQPINLNEIKATIKSFKTNTPGETKINKAILKKIS